MEDEITSDHPKSKGMKVRMTVFVDADHTNDLVNRRYLTGILLMLNNIPIRWAYGSELLASRIATEIILKVKFVLIKLGVDLDGTTLIVGFYMSLV
jgi:hypothetical protein